MVERRPERRPREDVKEDDEGDATEEDKESGGSPE